MTYWAHESAIVEEGSVVGDGTKIWVNSQIRSGAVIGRDCSIGKDVFIDTEVVIGDGCKVQNGAQLYRGLTVGNFVFIGPGVIFTNDLRPRAQGEWVVVPTLVEDFVSIGANATIVCGVTLQRGCLIGAGSVVTKSVESFAEVHGNPARHVGYIDVNGKKVLGQDRDSAT